MKIEKEIYNKRESFYRIKQSKSFKIDDNIYVQVKKSLNDKKLISKINQNHLPIIQKLKKDLFSENTENKQIKFKITENILKEIELLDYNNLLKFLVHRYRYDIYPQTFEFDDYPPYLQIEPTSFCNYRCVFCYQSNQNFSQKKNGFMGHMTYETFKEIIDQAEKNIEFISLASRGEPLMCRDIEKMLAYTRNKFLNLKINTNASLLTESKIHSILQSGIKTIVFSADAADEKLYEKLRVNGSFKKIMKNIILFKEIREKQYPKAKIISRVSGVKVTDSQKFDDMENVWNELVDQVAFVEYNPWEDVYSSKQNKIKTPCSDLWRRMFFWWDGLANPCEVDFKSLLQPGNIKDLRISSLWTGKIYKDLRQKHLSKLRGGVHPCDKCVTI